jgi:hypothetical protein
LSAATGSPLLQSMRRIGTGVSVSSVISTFLFVWCRLILVEYDIPGSGLIFPDPDFLILRIRIFWNRIFFDFKIKKKLPKTDLKSSRSASQDAERAARVGECHLLGRG